MLFRNAVSASVPARTPLLAAAALACAAASPALAYLGSFGQADGYTLSQWVGAVNWVDVSYYNAGQYGANVGNQPGPFLGTPNAGLWSINSQVGGFLPTTSMRTTYTPPVTGGYLGALPPGVPAYIVGDHWPGHNNDGNCLAVRNDSPAGTGPLNYTYRIDTYDTGGPVASSVTSGSVGVKFFYQASPEIPSGTGRAPDKFTMSFKDNAGNIGLQWGYTRDNEVVWRANGGWTYTGIYDNAGAWDGVRLNIDLTADTFQLEYYLDATSTWLTLAPAGTALGTPMGDLSKLDWQMEDAVSSGMYGGKNFFDDFSFTYPTPAPGTLALVGLGGLIGIRRRR